MNSPNRNADRWWSTFMDCEATGGGGRMNGELCTLSDRGGPIWWRADWDTMFHGIKIVSFMTQSINFYDYLFHNPIKITTLNHFPRFMNRSKESESCEVILASRSSWRGLFGKLLFSVEIKTMLSIFSTSAGHTLASYPSLMTLNWMWHCCCCRFYLPK